MTERDCSPDNPEFCADPIQEIAIEALVAHDGYDYRSTTRPDDIAIIRLKQKVQFTTFIRPICLPHSQPLQNRNYDNVDLTVTGWGKTENSEYSYPKCVSPHRII